MTNTSSNPAGSPTIKLKETRQTTKKGYDIPVPRREQVMADFEKIARANKDKKNESK
jgi:hypothetical protein